MLHYNDQWYWGIDPGLSFLEDELARKRGTADGARR